MPKFRSTVNPFKAKAEKTEAQKSVAEPVAARLPRAAHEPEPAASVSDSDGRDATETAVQELEKPAVAAMTPQPKKAARDGWISKLGSLKALWQWLPRRGNDTDKITQAVQGELSLDNIKVVRNDLSEADLEVVPLRLNSVKKARAADVEAGSEGAPAEEKAMAQADRS